MGPICPHCGHDDNVWCNASDSGSPDYIPGSNCNGCGGFVANDEWEYEDDEDQEIVDQDEGGHVKPGGGFISGWRSSDDLDNSETGPDEITSESRCPECGEYYSDCICRD